MAVSGPFRVGERVRVPAFDSAGEIVEVGETQTIRAFGMDVSDPDGEIRQVTSFTVRLDNGITRAVADRDGQILRE